MLINDISFSARPKSILIYLNVMQSVDLDHYDIVVALTNVIAKCLFLVLCYGGLFIR